MTVEEITDRVMKKVSMMLIELLPTPSCPLKRQQNEWKKEQVMTEIKNRINEKYNLNKAN